MLSAVFSTPISTQFLQNTHTDMELDKMSNMFEMVLENSDDSVNTSAQNIGNESSLSSSQSSEWIDNSPEIKNVFDLKTEDEEHVVCQLPKRQQGISVVTGIKDQMELFGDFQMYEPPLFGSELSFMKNESRLDESSLKPTCSGLLKAESNFDDLNIESDIIGNFKKEYLEKEENEGKDEKLNQETTVSHRVTPLTMMNLKKKDVTSISSSTKVDQQSVRLWKMKWATPSFQNLQFSVEMKHRRESKHQSVDEIFYSSLRYQLFFELASKSISQIQQLRVRISLVESTNNQVVEPVKGDKDVVRGSKFLLTNLCGQVLKGSTTIHIPSSYSYHFQRRDYRMIVEFFDRLDETLATPLFMLESPQFRLFARRPNKKQFSREKQKRLAAQKRSRSFVLEDQEASPKRSCPSPELKDTEQIAQAVNHLQNIMGFLSQSVETLNSYQRDTVTHAANSLLSSLCASNSN